MVQSLNRELRPLRPCERTVLLVGGLWEVAYTSYICHQVWHPPSTGMVTNPSNDLLPHFCTGLPHHKQSSWMLFCVSRLF